MLGNAWKVKARIARYWRVLFRLGRNVLALVGLGVIIFHFCFDLSVVVSGSMSPTLRGERSETTERDWVLSERVSYRFRSPRRWEVAKFRLRDETPVFKRIVAMPGETVTVKDLHLVINGSALSPPPSLGFLKYYGWGNLQGGRSFECSNGYYFLGDDSRDSVDSRFEGTVRLEDLSARAWLIVWPLNRIGLVNP